MSRCLAALMLLAWIGTRTPAAQGAPEAKGPAWRTSDGIVDGWDWSLPPGVRAAPNSAIKVSEKIAEPDFPGRLVHTVGATWRDVEPEEGQYRFEPLRQRILDASAGGKYAVEFWLRASVWEMRIFPEEAKYPKGWERDAQASAPRWLAQYHIPLIEESKHGLNNIGTPFQIINMNIYHPEYHSRYARMVRELGKSGILQMPEITLIRLGIMSSSRGEEGAGPAPGAPERALFLERLQAWAEAARGAQRKVMIVSNKDYDLQDALKLGMGQRNGFVEHYMGHCKNAMLGQGVDKDGYLVVDETNPMISENRASGDENEEYGPAMVPRFGPVATWPHRYHESMLRVLQMRRNYIWAEGGAKPMDPPLLRYVALELGKTVQDAPDAWCYLRESVIKDGDKPLAVKNFERWLYQRDTPGCVAQATERTTAIGKQLYRAPGHMYDDTARRTDQASGNTVIGFALDDRFLTGGPCAVAVKITYRDRGNAEWALEYQGAGGMKRKSVQCGDSGVVRTATFFLNDARMEGRRFADDFFIRALMGDAVISLVRVIKLQ